MVGAVRKIYPETALCLCDVHFKRCIRRRIQDAGLQTYMDQPGSHFSEWIRIVWTLALVPEKDIWWYWTEVRAKIRVNGKY